MALHDPYPSKPEGWKAEGEFREPIAKLGKMITDRIPQKLGLAKITENDPEYWALSQFVSDEEAELALKFGGIRKPKTFEELLKISGLEAEKLTQLLEHMSWTGILEWNYENPEHKKQWLVPMFVPGSAEFTNMNKDLMDAHPDMGLFFNQMSRLPLEKVTPMVPLGGAGVGMHVIPVEKAIEGCNEAISLEKISHWMDKYDGKYAASPCSCRRSRHTFDEGCADDEMDWCIAVGDMADYVVETNKGGRYITREEALAIMKKAEDNGFVHQITNIDGENKIFAICNCNVNVCYALRTSQLFNTPNLSRSAYVAKVEPANCVACGRCVEYCPAGAVKLGQKLCKADGSKVKYPVHMLPSEKKWSEADWDWNYRDTARIESYASGTAPCKTACPAHIAVQGYLKLAAQGRYEEALALIKKNNPLPAICGHICNKRCEAACTRGTIDEAVSIDEVKKFIAMRDLNSETRYIPPKVVPKVRGEFEEKVAIIGAGPAGISCAYYLAEKGYRPTIFEKNKQPGGMIVYGIPSFVLEKDVVAAEIDVLREMGVEIKCGIEVGKDVSIAELRAQGYRAFYIAIGCQEGKGVNASGSEGVSGIMTGVDFLHQTTEDENYKLEGTTVVVGGGNVAIDVSRSAIRAGSSKVYQLSLETRDIMPATPEEIALAESEGILVEGGWGPAEFLSEDGRVTGLVFKKCISVKNAEGRFDPQFDEKERKTVACDHVVLAVGQGIAWGGLLNGEEVKMWHGNYPVADPVTYQTDVKDIFVGGDVYTGPKFAIDAIAAGKEAAISIHRFVQPHSSLTIGRNPHQYVELDKENIKVDDYDHTGRQNPGRNEAIGKDSYRDGKLTFTEEQVKKETARCLSCGASVVDYNKCVGCGACTTKCMFDAIHLNRDLPEASVMRTSEEKLKYILPNGAKQAIKIKFSGKKEQEYQEL